MQAGAQSEKRPHIVGLDLTRVVVVALVVGVHTLSIAGGKVSGPLGAFITVFHSSREVFFLLTAFVLTYNYGHRREIRWRVFWRRRYSLVLPAYLVWSAIYFLADGRRLDPVSSALVAFGRDLLTAGARYQLYFLLATMQLYLVFPLLRWFLAKTARHHRVLFFAAVAYEIAFTIAIQHREVTTGPIGWWLRNPDSFLPSYGLYVIAGALGAWHFDRFVAVTRRHGAVVLGALCSGTAAAVGVYVVRTLIGRQSPSAASAVFQPVVVVESLAIAWALFAVGLWWVEAGARHRALVTTGADSSFGIFLAHPLVLQGVLALASATGVLPVVRRAPAGLELAVLLGIGLPLIYGFTGALVFLARRTPFSLVLTGRQRASTVARAARPTKATGPTLGPHRDGPQPSQADHVGQLVS